ncbi:mitogen-activated protein kinase [Malassezia cuniculi]|uniref:mitogen-activated protein kinase n=1 Tax=Malassezia cuniculi TaxID=948313 RepID=A0AAF0EWQ0_9BASI|nr:mitogen-activated protein kinase [Malassezia cuniculi]
MDAQPRVQYSVLSQQFQIDPGYAIVRGLGQGAYGCVASAVHKASGEQVAIKKITSVFSKRILTKRALREIKLLHHFRGHRNITCLYDLDIVNPNAFNEIYLYEEFMEADLHSIIRSKQPLSDAHYQSFIYQTLCGLKYIHSANVLHRDLKPGNLLVNADCELKICDFGLSRGFDLDQEAIEPGAQGLMTEYVATRWYRAPEIMLSYQNYTTAIDLWSVGCILAELLGGRPLFKGRDYVDQLNQILHYLGTPSTETLRRIGSPRAQQYIASLPYQAPVPFEKLFPEANPLALDLLRRLLAFDPSERISCVEALQHPYLAVWQDPADEPVCATKFDFSFERVNDTEGMRQLIIEEVTNFRYEVRRQALERQAALERENGAPEAVRTDSPYSPDQPSSSSRRHDLPLPNTESIERSTGTEKTRTPQDVEDPVGELERELRQQLQAS